MLRIMKRTAPTWFASPLRRLIQSACLLLFLVLFFYVCYPYTARPARIWGAWLPVEVDATSGRAKLKGDTSSGEPIALGTVLHVVDSNASPPEDFGPFRVTQVAKDTIAIEPTEPLGMDLRERMAESFGPWALHERPLGSWPSHYAEDRDAKEKIAAELFLAIDPLVSISTALAARAWVWSLTSAAVILLVCLFVPRGFCGYVCPMGTVLDLFDWTISRRIRRFRFRRRGWWAQLKYVLLAAVLAASLGGVLISGYLAAIPVITRGMAFLLAPLQTGFARGWHQVPPMDARHWISLAMFVVVLALGLLGPRFWCKCLCPTGAIFSIANAFRLTERRVATTCTSCGRCEQICPFDAIDPGSYATRTSECTLCRTCGGVCLKDAIHYTGRFAAGRASAAPPREPVETANQAGPLRRRAFLSTAAGLAAGMVAGAAAAIGTRAFGAPLDDVDAPRPVRPPGSVPEKEFLRLCIRCGECFRACPNNVLQPVGFSQGLEGLWTPEAVADWSGCEASCNHCGQVCPTGAIRALPLEEKRVARMGLAVVNPATCLPHARLQACQVCVDECHLAGYHAIEFLHVGTETDTTGKPIEDTGFLAPVVLPEKCVGCGLCQTRCRSVNVKQKGVLSEAAIRIEAGEGKEDRMTTGSYVELRSQEERQRKEQQRFGLRGKRTAP